MKRAIFQNFTLALLIVVMPSVTLSLGAEGLPPIADAGSSRYSALDPVVLDGTNSYVPDNSGLLNYTWRQISGPSVIIIDANTATPTIAGSIQPAPGRDPTPKPQGFTQTDAIQECEFELVVSDGELTSLPDTVKVIIVPDFGANTFQQENPPFDPDKPTMVYFGGGDCTNGLAVDCASPFTSAWLDRANIINFRNGYTPDSGTDERTYYRYGDMIIVYLSSVAPDYKQPIQTSGWSTGGQPAVDVGIHLNLTYADARYAINRVTFFDAVRYCRGYYNESISTFLDSSVDGEQCWADAYVSATSGGEVFVGGSSPFQDNMLNVGFPTATGSWFQCHVLAKYWYNNSLENNDMNQFNNGVTAGAYWSVIGPGKNLQLASTPGVQTYKFNWNGSSSSGYMDFDDESNYPGRLLEPITLVGPENDFLVDANGTLFSCEVSENAVGYQLLFGPDPYRVMDYYVISDTPNPPSEVITSSPFEQTWWTVKAYDQYGSTIYADPIRVNFEKIDPPLIENLTTGQIYSSVRHAVSDARNGHEIVVSPGVYQANINFHGKNLTVRSTNPNDSAVVASTIIAGDGNGDLVTFSGGEDENCVLAGFTVTGAKRGIYCSGSSPTITNCIITANVNADMGAGIFIKDGSNPTLVNCIFSSNSASVMGGGMYAENSNPILINCTFTRNSAAYFGGGIYCSGGSPVLTNCILWGDTPDEISTFIGIPMITYSDIHGGFSGDGNIDADPLFADPANGDFHLLAGSPCIDAGDPTTPVGLEPEPSGGIINMGVYGGTSEASKSP